MTKLNLFAVSSVLIFLSSLIMALLLFSRGKKSKVPNLWGFLCISTTLWAMAGLKYSTTLSYESAFFWWQVAYVAVILTPILYYHFVYEFLHLENRIYKIVLQLAYFLGFCFLILDLFFREIFINNLRLLFNQFYWHDWTKSCSWTHLIFYISFYWFLLSFSFFQLALRYFKSAGLYRNQLKYFLIGSIVGWLGPHGDYLIVFGINFYPYSNLLLIAYLLIFFYAILKYRLMDIRVAITRTSIFIAVYSLVLGIPFAMAFAWQNKLFHLLGNNWWLAPLISSTLLATIGPFVYLFVQKKTENALLREQRAYQNILRNASSGMIRIKDLKRLLNVVVHVITKTVKIKYAAVYLLDKETNNFILQAARGRFVSGKQSNYIDTGSPLIWQLSLRKNPIVMEEEVMKLRDEAQNQGVVKFVEQLLRLNAALIVPSFVDDKLIGILILGEKVSGKLYSEDDMLVFSVLANQSALAIENAQFYDEVKRTHEQLFQAEKMATIGTMADGLSHQINNRFHALSLIAGDSLDFLKHSDMSSFSAEAKLVLAELKNALERIENNVLQGGEVVRGLLKYSRPGESGFELVSFKDVLNGSIDMVQYKIKLKEIDLIQNIPSDLPKLYANLVQLQEVSFNLIDNAYDATKERQVTLKEEGYKGRIEISADCVNSSVEISVSDNGMGVKDLDRKKLFTPFFTTKATAKKGTGLGLYVIDKIISAHNGKIDISSVYKSGTRFTITLPISPKS
ncbi:MAG: hypothetical protein COY78_05590 [Candidatus Omnitrophica bacterium CG_4_10_14_0_8_um_filter_44_12]|nr:MAG: hypothetical protein COY78_05590 [Candidatus Omnitrophica bacterium CG_4_10_14_0_8_um_filter_44_12]